MRKTTHIRLELEDNEAEEFKAIQDRYGIKKNTELVRFVLHQEYLRLFPEHKTTEILEVATQIE